jgi:hypothetical protein
MTFGNVNRNALSFRPNGENLRQCDVAHADIHKCGLRLRGASTMGHLPMGRTSPKIPSGGASTTGLGQAALYRCCFQDSTGNPVELKVAAKDDAEAMEIARSTSANSRADWFELWQGKRCVHMEAAPALHC